MAGVLSSKPLYHGKGQLQMATYTKVCQFCGKEFLAVRSDTKFCSSAHKAASHRGNEMPPEYERACVHCGETFTAKRADTQFCSSRCKAANHRATDFDIEAERNPQRFKGYIYVIQEIDITGLYKIGKSANVKNRYIQFSIELPFNWRPIHKFAVKDMHRMETALHKRFEDKRERGEWFRLTKADVEYIKSLQDEQG